MKRFILLLALVIVSLSVSAQYYDFESGGIYYTIVSPTSVGSMAIIESSIVATSLSQNTLIIMEKTYKITRIGQRVISGITLVSHPLPLVARLNSLVLMHSLAVAASTLLPA